MLRQAFSFVVVLRNNITPPDFIIFLTDDGMITVKSNMGYKYKPEDIQLQKVPDKGSNKKIRQCADNSTFVNPSEIFFALPLCISVIPTVVSDCRFKT